MEINQEKVFSFNFNFVELNVLIKACRELPYKESAGLINKIMEEYEKQVSNKKDFSAKSEVKGEDISEVQG